MLKTLVFLLNIRVTNKKEVVLIYVLMKSGIAKMQLVVSFGKYFGIWIFYM